VSEIPLEAGYTQGIRAGEYNPVKRTFKILAADRNTIGGRTLPDGTLQRLGYNPKSHAKALAMWAGRPVIINHGRPEVRVVGEVTDADISEHGLILSFRVDDERTLELLNKDSYEGFSIGAIPTEVAADQVESYHPHELSVIMYPIRPACPKGVCDIISMTLSSCTHEGEGNHTNGDVMADETVNNNVVVSHNPDCKCKGEGAITSAKHEIAMRAKDERIAALESENKDLKSQVEGVSAELNKFVEEKRTALVSSLPKTNVDYSKMDLAAIETLVSFYQGVKTETAGAVETKPAEAAPAAAEENPEEKPWLPKGRKYNPGNW
jgi:hypothetical protein